MIVSMTSDSRNIAVVIGSSFPTRAAPIESLAVWSHSRAVACLSSLPTEKTVISTTKMSSIMGMKLGER